MFAVEAEQRLRLDSGEPHWEDALTRRALTLLVAPELRRGLRSPMALQAGDKVAHFEIQEPIGRGGMGEVYRATDSKLARDVAIKVLPDEFAQDEERLRRFQREAKVLAALNHPNIAAIYGVEQDGETHCLVLELVPGETLAERIARGPIPLDEAFAIGAKIADALERAHAHGIIHRDLKPANIKLTPDDDIKVLDFGLAKALLDDSPGGDSSTSMSPTITRDATRAGVVLGTAAYMSPEQAKGKRVDKRADIWAFGVLLYEMLTGVRAFSGEDVSDTLAYVLTKEPDWEALPEATPAPARQALKLCLAKNVKDRVRDIGDVCLAMEGAFETPGVAPLEGTFEGGRRFGTMRSSSALVLALGALIVGALLAGVALRLSPPRAPRVERFELTFPPDVELQSSFPVSTVALSRDGSKLAIRSGTLSPRGGKLVVRELGRLDAELLEGPSDVVLPVFSPDGEWIAFLDFAEAALKRVSVRGGAPLTICSVERYYGASWATDESIIFSDDRGLLRVPAVGGCARGRRPDRPRRGRSSIRLPGCVAG